jgi:ferredoxin
MAGLRYLEDDVTLRFDVSRCTGCQQCVLVCPHGVFAMDGNRAALVDRGACMECGACRLNCDFDAIEVTQGVGCAGAIIVGILKGTEPNCGGSEGADTAKAPGCC